MSKIERTIPLGMLVVMVGLSGCATTGLHQAPHNMTNIDPDTAIVMFSVMAAEPAEEQILELGWIGANGKFQMGSIKQKPSRDPIRTFALEIPGDYLALRAIKIKLGREWWKTTQGKNLKLEKGQITYIGRLEVREIQFVDRLNPGASRRTGESTRVLRPVAARLEFSDYGESDLATLKAKYTLLDEQAVPRRIPQEWGVDGHVVLAAAPKNVSSGTSGGWEILLELLGAFFSSAPPIGF